MKLIRLLLLLPLFLSLSCDRSTKPAFEKEGGENLRTIAYLKSLCRGSTFTITEDIYIEGVITANDLYGEFYKNLVIEDESGGITVAIDAVRLAQDYPMGCPVSLYCTGLVLGDYGGKIEIGTAPEGDYTVGRIPKERLDSYLRRRDITNAQQPEPMLITFGEVDNYLIDRYVRFEGVRFAETGAWCDIDMETGEFIATERMLVNDKGQTFLVRTLATCTYAKELLPQGTGSIAGIIDYFNGTFTLRVSDRRFWF